MDLAIEDALGPTVTPMQLVGEYRFRIGDLMTPITIRLWRGVGKETTVWYSPSHHLQIPKHPPFTGTTSIDCGDSEASALRRAVSLYMEAYNGAVGDGCLPVEEWLVPNPNFY